MSSYSLTVNNDSGSQLTLSTQYPEEILRLLQLSGHSVEEPVIAHDASCDCEVCVGAMVMEQQAEHDYGKGAQTDEVEFDIKDYNFKGRADLPERLTSAKYGSNPLKSEMKEQFSYESMRAAYEEFLTESENEAGLLSPLTADARDDFDKDPLADDDAVTDGSHSPLSTIKLQELPK